MTGFLRDLGRLAEEGREAAGDAVDVASPMATETAAQAAAAAAASAPVEDGAGTAAVDAAAPAGHRTHGHGSAGQGGGNKFPTAPGTIFEVRGEINKSVKVRFEITSQGKYVCMRGCHPNKQPKKPVKWYDLARWHVDQHHGGAAGPPTKKITSFFTKSTREQEAKRAFAPVAARRKQEAGGGPGPQRAG